MIFDPSKKMQCTFAHPYFLAWTHAGYVTRNAYVHENIQTHDGVKSALLQVYAVFQICSYKELASSKHQSFNSFIIFFLKQFLSFNHFISDKAWVSPTPSLSFLSSQVHMQPRREHKPGEVWMMQGQVHSLPLYFESFQFY